MRFSENHLSRKNKWHTVTKSIAEKKGSLQNLALNLLSR